MFLFLFLVSFLPFSYSSSVADNYCCDGVFSIESCSLGFPTFPRYYLPSSSGQILVQDVFDGFVESQGDDMLNECRPSSPSVTSSDCTSRCSFPGFNVSSGCSGFPDYCKQGNCTSPGVCWCRTKYGVRGQFVRVDGVLQRVFSTICSVREREVVVSRPPVVILLGGSPHYGSDNEMGSPFPENGTVSVVALPTHPAYPSVPFKPTIRFRFFQASTGVNVRIESNMGDLGPWVSIMGNSFKDLYVDAIGCTPYGDYKFRRSSFASDFYGSVPFTVAVTGPTLCGPQGLDRPPAGSDMAIALKALLDGHNTTYPHNSFVRLSGVLYAMTDSTHSYLSSPKVRSALKIMSGDSSANTFSLTDDGYNAYLLYPTDDSKVISYQCLGQSSNMECSNKVCVAPVGDVCVSGNPVTLYSYMGTDVYSQTYQCPQPPKVAKAEDKDCALEFFLGIFPLEYECTNWYWMIAYMVIFWLVCWKATSLLMPILSLVFPIIGIFYLFWRIVLFIWNIPDAPVIVWVRGKVYSSLLWAKSGFVKPTGAEVIVIIMLVPLVCAYQPYSTACAVTNQISSSPLPGCSSFTTNPAACPIPVVVQGSLVHPGYVSCSSAYYMNRPAYNVYVEWVDATTIVISNKLMSTADYSKNVGDVTDSVLHCKGKNICTGDKCSKMQPTDSTCGGNFHNPYVTNYPGFTECTTDGSSDFHGCTEAHPCICSRGSARPVGPAMDVHEPTSASLTVTMRVTIVDSSSGNIIAQMITDDLTGTVNNITYATSSIAVDAFTYFGDNKVFYDPQTTTAYWGPSSPVGSPTVTTPGDIQAVDIPTLMGPSSTMSPSSFAIAPWNEVFVRSVVKGKGSYTIQPSGMSLVTSQYKQFPITIGPDVFTVDSGGQMKSNPVNPGQVTYDISYPPGFTLATVQNQVCPTSTDDNLVATGCYQCSGTAYFTVNLSSKCQSGPANVAVSGPNSCRANIFTSSIILNTTSQLYTIYYASECADQDFSLCVQGADADPTTTDQEVCFTVSGTLVPDDKIVPRNATNAGGSSEGGGGGGFKFHMKKLFHGLKKFFHLDFKRFVIGLIICFVVVCLVLAGVYLFPIFVQCFSLRKAKSEDVEMTKVESVPLLPPSSRAASRRSQPYKKSVPPQSP